MPSIISLLSLPDGDDDYLSYLQSLIENPNHVFNEALVIDPESINQRAVVDNVEITKAEVKDNKITVEYTVSYSWYYGCDDANGSKEVKDSITGSKILSYWIFDKAIRTPECDDSDY